jgi:threonine synthase
VYDPDRPLPHADTISSRAPSLWRYREWLPFEGEPVLSLDSGFTPLVEAPELARRLGVARLWIKNDSVSHPTLSFKDRVVAAAINAARAFGLDTLGCASTGNLANAVAAQAARAGLAAWIFIPDDLEPAGGGRVGGNPRLVRVRGNYDDERPRTQAADRFGGPVNINLRGTTARVRWSPRICERLGCRRPRSWRRWRWPAGHRWGSAAEFAKAGWCRGRPRLYGAQADGCAPIVRLVSRAAASARHPAHHRARSPSAIRPTGASPRRRSAAPRLVAAVGSRYRRGDPAAETTTSPRRRAATVSGARSRAAATP